jgi:hypothetical protein
LFPFDKIMGLHLCSFVIIQEADGSDPRLVFEATFDGPREEFLDDLLRVARGGVHAIYQHCEGYPASGRILPELIKDYLRINDAGAQTFFTGSPGRSVAQIRGEHQIRDRIVAHIAKLTTRDDAPTTFLELQRELQHEVIRAHPQNHWAEQPAAVPWEAKLRIPVLAGVVGAAALLACGLGALILRLFGYGFSEVRDWIGWLVTKAVEIGQNIVSLRIFTPFVEILQQFRVPILDSMVLLVVAWLLLRAAQLLLQRDNPRDTHFWIRFAVHILVIARYTILVFIVGSAILMPLVPRSLPQAPSWGVTSWVLAGVAVVLLTLKHWATSLNLIVQFQELSPAAENVRRFLRDLVRFAMATLVVWALAVLGLHFQEIFTGPFGKRVFTSTQAVLVFIIYGVVGILIVYALAFIALSLVRLRELSDLRRFTPATDLPSADTSGYEREEGGVNKYQNHLCSLTYVKPGWFRWLLLRVTLFVIALLARFWFNQGDLGGIPTILAARWTLIDNGRRLLFFSNYGGGWESYLNEFIDMGAVNGLNAIWTNTFLDKPHRYYAFPATKYYLWRGAENERPFKNYVRQSQIETLVWYSAYPTLTIININRNTALRQALFKPLKPFELDSVFLKAGL